MNDREIEKIKSIEHLSSQGRQISTYERNKALDKINLIAKELIPHDFKWGQPVWVWDDAENKTKGIFYKISQDGSRFFAMTSASKIYDWDNCEPRED